MADLAKIGFAADTKALSDAKGKLDALVPSAARAEKATDKFNRAAAGITRSASGAATGVKGFGSAVQQAARGANAAGTGFERLDAAMARTGSSSRKVAAGALAASTALGTVQAAAAGAAGSIKVAGVAAQQFGPPTAAWLAYKDALAKIPPAATQAKTSLDRLGSAANDNINKLQSTPGNIAAQFQDIGVTAFGGMSPLLIGLQQGTQLSGAFANGLGPLVAGLRQVFSATAILTIGLVALIAALIQAVNWTKLAQSALRGMADIAKTAAPYVATLGAVLLVAFAPQLIVLITRIAFAIGRTLVTAIVAATQAMIAFALANPFTAFVLAAALAVAAMTYFGVITREQIYKVLGYFVGAYNGIKKTWSMIPAVLGDVAYQAANATLAGIDFLVNRGIASVNQLIERVNSVPGVDIGKLGNVTVGRVENPYAGAAAKYDNIRADEIGKADGKDYVGAFIKGAQDIGGKVADLFRGWANKLGAKDGKKAKGAKDAADGTANAWANIMEGAENDIAKERARAEATTLSAEAAATLEQKTKLLGQANSAGIKLTEAMRAKIDQLAAAYGKAKIAADDALAMRDIVKGSNETIAALEAERAMIGKYGRDLAYATEYARLFAEAKSKLSPDALQKAIPTLQQQASRFADVSAGNDTARFMEEQRVAAQQRMDDLQAERQQIGMSSQATAAFRLEYDLLSEAKRRNIALTPAEIAQLKQYAQEQAALAAQIGYTRDAFDFAREGAKGFLTDLRSGLEQGKGFFRSFADSVSNMLNKVIDKLMDLTIDAALSGNTGGSMGFINALGSVFGGKGGNPFQRTPAPVINNALGGVYGREGRVTKYAKGGIVSRPTFFDSASGVGQMGEAGPEGILPLKRGPDGSLGVQAHGGGNQRVMSAPTVTIENHYTISGSSTADMQATVQAAAERQRAQLRTEVPAIIAEYQTNGAVL